MKKLSILGNIPFFRLGFALSTLAVFLFLGVSCTEPLTESEDDGDLITVSVSVPQQNARSITADDGQDPNWLNYYEVVFWNKQTGTSAKYVSVGVKADGGPLTAKLLPDTYDMLFLAGNYDRRVLLFSDLQVDVPVYKGRGPISVIAGAILVDPENEFWFDWNSTPVNPDYVVDSPAAITIPLRTDTTAFSATDFTAEFKLNGFANLDAAKTARGGDATTLFAKNNLAFRTISEESFNILAADIDGTTPAVSGDVLTLTYTIDRDDMPNIDVTGLLYFQLEYYPFSDNTTNEGKKNKKWYIRNGLTYEEDVNGKGNGSAVVVTVGDGGTLGVEVGVNH